jgi:PPOX class probable F420-dependent enzyme
MPNRRDAIRMSAEEIACFLEGCKSLNVATLDRTGAPHLTTLWFAIREGTILFETYGTSQKVANLRRDPRIALLCEQGTTYEELRGVSVQGRAEIVDDGDRLNDLMACIVRRNRPDLAPDIVASHVAEMIGKRVVIVVHPERIMSWDHHKLVCC